MKGGDPFLVTAATMGGALLGTAAVVGNRYFQQNIVPWINNDFKGNRPPREGEIFDHTAFRPRRHSEDESHRHRSMATRTRTQFRKQPRQHSQISRSSTSATPVATKAKRRSPHRRVTFADQFPIARPSPIARSSKRSGILSFATSPRTNGARSSLFPTHGIPVLHHVPTQPIADRSRNYRFIHENFDVIQNDGKGNCFFHALSQIRTGSVDSAPLYRHQIANYIDAFFRNHREDPNFRYTFSTLYLPERGDRPCDENDWVCRVENLRRNGRYAGHLEIVAAMMLFQIRFRLWAPNDKGSFDWYVMTTFEDFTNGSLVPDRINAASELYHLLNHNGAHHYEWLRPKDNHDERIHHAFPIPGL